MDEKIINNIREQIEFLKADLNCTFPNSELGAKRMVDAREATKQKILLLMDRLVGIEPSSEDKQYYRQMLERIVTDHSALDTVKEAVEGMDDEEVKQEILENAVIQYEMTKRDIAAKLLEKLG